ncbi:MAG TPA: hypothetical protein VFJ24_01655 [Gaiellales bacterium]|nr:hypothetical protein [Gaiellales bacterium]
MPAQPGRVAPDAADVATLAERALALTVSTIHKDVEWIAQIVPLRQLDSEERYALATYADRLRQIVKDERAAELARDVDSLSQDELIALIDKLRGEIGMPPLGAAAR